jgi:hypothetical protein
MNKIVALSKYGFKLDSLKNNWEKVDKSLLNRELFQSLEKGMSIDVKGRNREGFITEFVVNKPLSLDLEFNMNASHKHRDILKGQCLNIVFNSLIGQDLGFDKNRETGIRIAQKLFAELEAANYYNW